MKAVQRLFACISLVCLLLPQGCATREISERTPIPVPQGLDLPGIRQAIQGALGTARHQHRWQIANWVVEQETGSAIIAGLHYRGKYAQLEVAYSPTQVITRILGSRNFKQSENRIHRTVLQLQEQLEESIAAHLGAAADARGLSPPPRETDS